MEQKYADIIKLGTSALSDAMDRLGIPGQALGIKPVDRSLQGGESAIWLIQIPVRVRVQPATASSHGAVGSIGECRDCGRQ